MRQCYSCVTMARKCSIKFEAFLTRELEAFNFLDEAVIFGRWIQLIDIKMFLIKLQETFKGVGTTLLFQTGTDIGFSAFGCLLGVFGSISSVKKKKDRHGLARSTCKTEIQIHP